MRFVNDIHRAEELDEGESAFYKQIKRVNPAEPQFLSLSLFLSREKKEKDETIFPDSLAFITYDALS